MSGRTGFLVNLLLISMAVFLGGMGEFFFVMMGGLLALNATPHPDEAP
jgi:hypothetical protein